MANGRRRRGTLLRAGTVLLVALGLAACEPVADDDAPKPARTPPPSRFDENIAWLGPRYGNLAFHSVDSRRRPEFFVNYGEPTPPDPGSGDVWHFPLTVLTAPRRNETRRRLRRSLGAGVLTKRGTRYGCRRSEGSQRLAVLTATMRVEITGGDCQRLLRASPHLRLPASPGRAVQHNPSPASRPTDHPLTGRRAEVIGKHAADHRYPETDGLLG